MQLYFSGVASAVEVSMLMSAGVHFFKVKPVGTAATAA